MTREKLELLVNMDSKIRELGEDIKDLEESINMINTGESYMMIGAKNEKKHYIAESDAIEMLEWMVNKKKKVLVTLEKEFNEA